MRKILQTSLALCLAIPLLYGCNGGGGGTGDTNSGGSGSGSNGSSGQVNGVLVDSAVAGVHYACSPSGNSGNTNSQGEFTCNTGDTVTFSLGAITFSSTSATTTITPLSLADPLSINYPQTIENIARFLQSLDSDNNPDNGINITEETASALQNSTINFGQDTAGFETAYNTIRDVLPNNPILIDAATANSHLDNTLANLDLDGDGFTPAAGDCLDFSPFPSINAAEVFPGATDICDDGLDNDCNGITDDGCTTACTLTCGSNGTYTYTCGSNSYNTETTWCYPDNSGTGYASSIIRTFSNGHTVTCTPTSCGSNVYECHDDTGSADTCYW